MNTTEKLTQIHDNPILDLLQSLDNDDTIDVSEVLKHVENMNKRKLMKDKYQDKIKKRGDDDRVYVYINRKQIIAQDIDELYSKLYDMEYGKETYSMEDIFPLWMCWKRDNTAISGRTLRHLSEDWNHHFAKYDIIHTPVVELTSKDFVDLFRSWTCKRQMTAKMFNNLKSICNGIFSYAITELEIIYHNPLKGIDMKQFPMKPPKNNTDNVFTEADRRAMLEHLKDSNDPYDLAICFDFHVTLRFAELSALKKSDYVNGAINVSNQHLIDTEMSDDLTFAKNHYINTEHIKGYTEHGYRTIPLNDAARSIIERAIALNPDGEYIFMFEGHQMSVSTFNARLRRYSKEIGIPYHSSHKIRFCVASVLYKNGVPITELQKMLGHSTVQMTLHYLRNVSANSDTLDIMQKCL